MTSKPYKMFPIHFKNEEEKKMVFEQYKMLIESINKLHETREYSNNFWIAVHGIVSSAILYMRDTHNIAHQHKLFVILALITMGILLCFSWLRYLITIKKSLSTRGWFLVELEKNFKIPLFSGVFSLPQDQPDKASLTRQEMLVPCIFLAGYFSFTFILLFFTHEAVTSVVHAS